MAALLAFKPGRWRRGRMEATSAPSRIEAAGGDNLAMVAEGARHHSGGDHGAARERARAAFRPLDGASLFPLGQLVEKKGFAMPASRTAQMSS